MMIYTGIDIWNSQTLEHHGVKGMKWGVRKQIPLIGRMRRPAMPHISGQNRARGNADKSAIRRKRLKRAVVGGAAIAGTALAAYGAYKMSKYVSTPGGKAALKNGIDFIKTKTVHGAQRARLAGQGISRTVSNMPGARAAAKAYAAASLVSDVNSAQQFARHVHKNGKITGKDLKNFAIDIAMPIPDNIPGISRNKYDKESRW